MHVETLSHVSVETSRAPDMTVDGPSTSMQRALQLLVPEKLDASTLRSGNKPQVTSMIHFDLATAGGSGTVAFEPSRYSPLLRKFRCHAQARQPRCRALRLVSLGISRQDLDPLAWVFASCSRTQEPVKHNSLRHVGDRLQTLVMMLRVIMSTRMR